MRKYQPMFNAESIVGVNPHCPRQSYERHDDEASTSPRYSLMSVPSDLVRDVKEQRSMQQVFLEKLTTGVHDKLPSFTVECNRTQQRSFVATISTRDPIHGSIKSSINVGIIVPTVMMMAVSGVAASLVWTTLPHCRTHSMREAT